MIVSFIFKKIFKTAFKTGFLHKMYLCVRVGNLNQLFSTIKISVFKILNILKTYKYESTLKDIWKKNIYSECSLVPIK